MADVLSVDELKEKIGSLAIVGGGAMGEALVCGLLKAGAVEPASVVVANPGMDKRVHLSHAYGVSCVADASEIVHPETVVLAVKPQILPDVASGLSQVATFDPKRVISIAAGVTLAALRSWFPQSYHVRAMPNAPLKVGEGMTAVSVDDARDADEVACALGLFDCMGQAVLIDEALQNAAVAVSGSGPAYFALFAESVARAGVELGLDEETALRMSVATMKGTVALLSSQDMTPGQLVEAASTPGGTTVAAIDRMKGEGVDNGIVNGVHAASERAGELG